MHMYVQVDYSLEGGVWYVTYVDSTCRDDVTSSELVNGGTIHDIISIQTMTLFEEEAGVGRSIWDSGRE